MGENEIIELLQSDATDLDDCAALPPPVPGTTPLVTTDSLVEGTHFRRDWSSPADLARKLFQVNLSDLCASGGEPAWALLNLGLPAGHDPSFVRAFAAALAGELQATGCALIGGDTFRSPGVLLSLTLGGPARRVLTRQGGRPGDDLYLTGSIGLSLAGFRLLAGQVATPEEETKDEAVRLALERHLRPTARVAWARTIAGREDVHAMMDLSDGIFYDAPRLALASGVELQVDLDRLPVARAALERSWITRDESPFSGEEYELLFLAAPGLDFDFPCRAVGRALATSAGGPGVRYLRAGSVVDLEETRRGVGFEHFDPGRAESN